MQETVDDMLRFVTFYLMFAVVVAQLVISAFVDKQPVGAVPLEDEVMNRGCIQDFVVILCCYSLVWRQKKREKDIFTVDEATSENFNLLLAIL